MKKTFYVLLFILSYGIVKSQSCYVRLDDASGFATDQYQATLEAAACDLVQTLPEAFQNDFKVYDFGFYTQQEFFQNGFESVWERVNEDITPYYLIFGKQLSGLSVAPSVWVEIVLPNRGELECITPEKTDGLKYALELILRQSESPYDWPQYELEAIEKATEFIQQVLECCSTYESRYRTSSFIDSSFLSINLCIDNSCQDDPPNSVSIISNTPRMPELAFQLEYYGDTLCTSLNVELRVTYKRTTAVTSRNRQDSIQVFLNDVELGFNYVFDTGELIHGGRAFIIVKDAYDEEIKRFPFTIKALNPTARMVYDYIDEERYANDFWFLKRIATHENGAHPQTLDSKLWQFNEFNALHENLNEDWDASSRCPNLSNNRDSGWGLAQMTVPKPRKEALWNWKNNIDDAHDLLENKATSVRRRLESWLPLVNRWNDENATDTVSYHSDFVDGSITWVHAMNDYFAGNTDIEAHFPDNLQVGERSFLDAMIIKTYNGLGSGSNDHHYYYLIQNTDVDPATGQAIYQKPEWHVDNTAHYGGGVNHYVRSISNTNIPQN